MTRLDSPLRQKLGEERMSFVVGVVAGEKKLAYYVGKEKEKQALSTLREVAGTTSSFEEVEVWVKEEVGKKIYPL